MQEKANVTGKIVAKPKIYITLYVTRGYNLNILGEVLGRDPMRGLHILSIKYLIYPVFHLIF